MNAFDDEHRATISDVARAAGVSRATVSRVANGLSTVAPEIAARVETAIRELNYRPSPTARNLSLGRTNTVAVVVPDLGNPMFQSVLHGVSRAAAEDGYQVLVADTRESAEAERNIAIDARRRCDALVLCAPRMADAPLAEVIAAAKPLAIVNRPVEDQSVPQVSVDYVQAIGLLIHHLVALGHGSILYLGGPPTSAANRQRLAGLDAASAKHRRVTFAQLTVGSTLDDGWASAEAALGSGATAVVAFNDLVALGLLSRLREMGVRVPERLSVVGVDNIPFARFSTPTLTSVSLPRDDLGVQAWRRLHAVISGEPMPGSPWLEGRLEQRSSSGAPAMV